VLGRREPVAMSRWHDNDEDLAQLHPIEAASIRLCRDAKDGRGLAVRLADPLNKEALRAEIATHGSWFTPGSTFIGFVGPGAGYTPVDSIRAELQTLNNLKLLIECYSAHLREDLKLLTFKHDPHYVGKVAV
jgi:hypothetical protein